MTFGARPLCSRLCSRLCSGAALVSALVASAAVAQVLSPRLAATLAGKGIEPVPVEIWTAPGAPAPPGAEAVEPDHYLAAYPPGEVAALAAQGTVAYVAPADPVWAPDSLDAPPETALVPEDGQAPEAKAFTPMTAIWPAGTGRGVIIGVLDFGEVPARAAVAAQRSFGRGGASGHCAMVLDILRALAPGARLVVATLSPAAASAGDLQRAALWLERQGAGIITFSGASYANRRDGLAPIDRIVDAQVARGIVWVAASGNEAQRSWTGLAQDRDRDGLVDIAPGRNAVTLAARGPVSLALTWDDWGQGGPPRGALDIDLVVSDLAGREIAAERTRRLPVGEPVKTLPLPRLAPGTYRIALPLRGNGGPVGVRLTATGMATYLDPAVPYASIGNPATAQGAITVAAVDPRQGVTAPYSGQGPTADRRAKPELGASGVGAAGRVGSSFAAPRIAAMAARLLSDHPGWGPAAVRLALARYGRPLQRRSVIGEAARWIDTRGHGEP